MDYEYAALENDGDVRFIRLLPYYFSQDAPLQIELVTGRLGDAASQSPCSHVYEALSYAWEGQTPDRTVLCQGRRLLVTANCEAAMRQLRRRTRARLLWIDAICIDQTSVQDKSRQVQRMGDIYQQAQRVVVWLGEGSPDILRLFRNLRLFSHLKKIPWYPLTRRLQRKLAVKIDQMQKLDAKQIAQLPRQGMFVIVPDDRVLSEVFARSWFTRMWTLQEVALASSCIVCKRPGNNGSPLASYLTADTFSFPHIQVHCGEAVLPWRVLSGLDSYFLSAGKERRADAPVGIHREIARRIGEVRKQQFGADPERRLAQILNSARTKHVTEPRDRIYALHGIFGALGVHLPPPDYGKSVWEVFRDAVVMVMQTDQAFTILEQVCGPPSDPGSPSWVPNLNNPNSRWIPVNFFFRPAKESPVEFELLEGATQLRVWGKAIDTITAVAPSLEAAQFLEGTPTDAQTHLEGFRSGVELVKAMKQWLQLALSDPHEEDMKVTFVKLLKALLYTDLPPDEHAEDFYNWLRVLLLMERRGRGTETPAGTDGRARFRQWLRELAGEPAETDVRESDPADGGDSPGDKQGRTEESTKKVNKPSGSDATKQHPDPDQVAAFGAFYNYENPELKQIQQSVEFHQLGYLLGNNAAAHQFQRSFLRVNRHRRLFWTAQGRLGNGCDAVLPGDRVVLVSGARQPFVVRERGDDGTFTLVGPAYVSGGVMHGEAWGEDWSRERGLDRIDLV